MKRRPDHAIRGAERDLALLFRALAFAAHKHRDQRRKDAEASPYINHPIALAEVLAGEGGIADVEVLAAALLHDTIEDTDTRFEELEREFGARIAGMVAEVTDDKNLEKSERKRLQVEHAAGISPGAKLVKLADKICNLRDVAGRAARAMGARAPPGIFRVGEAGDRPSARRAPGARGDLRRRVSP